MEIQTLEEFEKMGKKSDASKTNKRKFQEMLQKALMCDGLDDKNMRYIFSCASLGSGLVVMNWLYTIKDEMQVNALINKIINSSFFLKNEQRNSYRFVSWILGTLMTRLATLHRVPHIFQSVC